MTIRPNHHVGTTYSAAVPGEEYSSERQFNREMLRVYGAGADGRAFVPIALPRRQRRYLKEVIGATSPWVRNGNKSFVTLSVEQVAALYRQGREDPGPAGRVAVSVINHACSAAMFDVLERNHGLLSQHGRREPCALVPLRSHGDQSLIEAVARRTCSLYRDPFGTPYMALSATDLQRLHECAADLGAAHHARAAAFLRYLRDTESSGRGGPASATAPVPPGHPHDVLAWQPPVQIFSGVPPAARVAPWPGQPSNGLFVPAASAAGYAARLAVVHHPPARGRSTEHAGHSALAAARLQHITDEPLVHRPAELSALDEQKLRYGGLRPPAHTLVRLGLPVGQPEAFINANRCHVGGRDFIACQAPMAGPPVHPHRTGTIGDHWQMIFENDVACSVNLAQWAECDPRVGKADCYWPGLGQRFTAGPIDVFCESETFDPTTTIYTRHFLLRDQRSGAEKRTTMLHYDSWADDRGPRSMADLDQLCAQALHYGAAGRSGQRSPIVVHCSAGMGRTGTAIAAMGMVAARAASQPLPDVDTIVRNLRASRGYMCVKTVEQLMFLDQYRSFLAGGGRR